MIKTAFLGNIDFCTRFSKIFPDLGNSALDMQIVQFLLSYQCSEAVAALMKRQALLTVQAKLKLAIFVSVAIQSGEILVSMWREEGTLKS